MIWCRGYGISQPSLWGNDPLLVGQLKVQRGQLLPDG